MGRTSYPKKLDSHGTIVLVTTGNRQAHFRRSKLLKELFPYLRGAGNPQIADNPAYGAKVMLLLPHEISKNDASE